MYKQLLSRATKYKEQKSILEKAKTPNKPATALAQRTTPLKAAQLQIKNGPTQQTKVPEADSFQEEYTQN